MSRERRQHERFELLAQIELSRGTKIETFVAINISAGGVLLRNDDNVEFSVGETVRIQFDVPELAAKFAIDATVIRTIAPTARPAAIAAMWTSSDAPATAALGEMLWRLKGT
ncbi:MAG TPA: PilZ domain-containing protein [Kofleriaceae bacterium]|nr:PilZ domain-containing protein [Kofleriaceae bacterium]